MKQLIINLIDFFILTIEEVISLFKSFISNTNSFFTALHKDTWLENKNK